MFFNFKRTAPRRRQRRTFNKNFASAAVHSGPQFIVFTAVLFQATPLSAMAMPQCLYFFNINEPRVYGLFIE
jgi:hypothetical protein